MDISTEDKIKDAARKIFQQKGFGLTRTRDIAEEAGINLALLNYYFRSKQKLFELIMIESLHEIFSFLKNIINNPKTSLSNKIESIVKRYTEELIKNPNLPLFVFNGLQNNPEDFIKNAGFPENLIAESIMFKQIKEQAEIKKLNINPLHFFINIISLSIFPIIGEPLIINFHKMKKEEYKEFINQRTILIPLWINQILKIDE